MKWKYRFGAVAGNTLEYYDVAVFAAISGYLSAELTRLGYHQATEMVWGIFALRFLVRPIGGYVIGRYADRAGKKSALVLTSLITGVATLCMAFLPINLLGNYTPIAILILQMALSFSFAGEYPSLITYLFRCSKKNEQARISSIISGSSVFGITISLSIVFILEFFLSSETMQEVGWRIPLLLGFLNIGISFWFRLKLPSHSEINETKLNFKDIIQVFFLTIPGTVIFFALNFSSTLLLETLNLFEFKSLYGIIQSLLLLLFMLICGYLTDKYSESKKIFDIGIIGMVILSVPLYWLISTQILFLVIFSQTIITLYAAMILCNFSFALSFASKGITANLAIGFNLAATMLGGITPLVTTYLVNIHVVYIGLFLALCGFSRFIIFSKNNSIIKSTEAQL